MKIKIFIAILLGLLYYQLEYKRHFVYNNDRTKVITIWQRLGNRCLVIPGKYYLPFRPEDGYLETKNYRNYIGIVFKTGDEYNLKISAYNSVTKNKLNNDIKLYKNNDSLLLEYHILDSLNINSGVRITSKSRETKQRLSDYVYIDLNRIYGIKVYR